MIVLYTGRRGSGKTTTLVKDAYHFHRLGWTIITNMASLSFADEVLSEQEILGLITTERTDFVIVIDEIQTFIDSRRAMRGKNVTFTYFIQQIRKRNVVILAATQFSRRVDTAFREHVDVIARPRYYKQFPVVVVTYYDRTASEDFYEFEDETLLPSVRLVYDPRPVFALFDTNEVITPAGS